MDRLRALELPARGRARAPPARRRAAQPRARPPRPPRHRSRPTATRSCGSSRTGRGGHGGRAARVRRVPGGADASSSPRTTRCRPSPACPGAHNRENAAAATAAARAAGTSRRRDRRGAAHVPGRRRTGSSSSPRSDGVRYVNDSKATNIAAARRALAAYDEPLHVILGGSRKGEDFDAARRARCRRPART